VDIFKDDKRCFKPKYLMRLQLEIVHDYLDLYDGFKHSLGASWGALIDVKGTQDRLYN